MRNRIMSVFLVVAIFFTFLVPAYASVKYMPGTAPIMYGPLYDANGREYHYNQSVGAYMSNGSQLPAGHPLYEKKGCKGYVYYDNPTSQEVYQSASDTWTALGVFLGIMLLDAIINDNQTVNQNEQQQYLASLQDDINNLAKNEKYCVTYAVGMIGVGKFLNALKMYCEEKNMPYQTSVYDNIIYFSYLNNEQNDDRSRIETEFTYKFDSNNGNCEITVSAPSVKLSKTIHTDFTEPLPRNLHEFGLDLMKEPGTVNGHIGYFVKDVTSWSRADRLGLRKSDHIIKINDQCIKEDEKQQKILNVINRQLYKNKYPIILYILRYGNIQQLTVSM